MSRKFSVLVTQVTDDGMIITQLEGTTVKCQ